MPIGHDKKEPEETSISGTGGVRDVTQFMNEDAIKVKEALAKQSKVDFYIPLDQGEKFGTAFETWTTNGYRLEIKKGMMVSLPRQVAQELADYLNIQNVVGRDKLIGRDEATLKALS